MKINTTAKDLNNTIFQKQEGAISISKGVARLNRPITFKGRSLTIVGAVIEEYCSNCGDHTENLVTIEKGFDGVLFNLHGDQELTLKNLNILEGRKI